MSKSPSRVRFQDSSLKKLSTAVTALAVAAAFGLAVPVLATPPAEKAAPAFAVPDLDGALELRATDASTTSGLFGRAGSLVSFASRVEDEVVRVELQVNSVVLEASRDLATGAVTWTGHDAALFPEDREALIAFSRKLQEELELDTRTLSPQEDLLHRVVMLWAEAPAGLVLSQRTAQPRDARITQAGKLGKGEDTLRSSLGTKACYVGDNNGIAYISCSTANRIMCHDQDGGGHCWTCFSVATGCGANCLSECGPGCAGLNVWTLDCGDHDDCCRVHGGCINPFDGECGDEYGEASDDFLFGFPNCSC